MAKKLDGKQVILDSFALCNYNEDLFREYIRLILRADSKKVEQVVQYAVMNMAKAKDGQHLAAIVGVHPDQHFAQEPD